MIILEARIYAFGGLEDKIIKFDKEINVIYGENEKGKSTIENFIKVMLYGINKKKNKEERERYVHNLGTAKGELIIEYKGRKLLIKRTFGKTKKEDKSVIIDCDTGEKVLNIDLDMPGEDFLNINRSTFEKTLFISQLGVEFTKDKEEEIMDKITSMFGVEESEVPSIKAIEKIETSKKNLHTVRGIGKIDVLKKQRDKLLEEKFEGQKIAEKNIKWENELLLEKSKRKNLNDEIKKLEIYKKYIKKINIQKEYKEINEYLMKSQDLKQKEEQMDNELKKGDEVIDLAFINKLKEYNNKYSFVKDKYDAVVREVDNLNRKFQCLENKCADYSYLNNFENGIKDKLVSLKYEMKSYKEKIIINEEIIKSIDEDEKKLSIKKNQIKNFNKIDKIAVQLEECLIRYEDKLKNLSYLMENNDNYNRNYFKHRKTKFSISIILDLFLFLIGVIISINGIIYIGIIMVIISCFIFIYFVGEIKNDVKNISNLNNINNIQYEVEDIENTIDMYCNKINVKDYKELILCFRKYKEFKELESSINIRISEKKKIVDYNNYENIKKKYIKDSEIVQALKNVSRCTEIDDILKQIEEYENLKIDLKSLIAEKDVKLKELQDIKYRLDEIKNKLTENLSIMGLGEQNIFELNKIFNEYEEKIKKREEIHLSLMSVEKTYQYLIKDKNIDDIKNELQNIIKSDSSCFYKSEEEIEVEEKKKSRQLIECEKNIKDLENNINTRLIGKRTLIEIEEELYNVEEEIKTGEKEYKALSIASNYILKADDEIRRNIGPKINKLVSEYFSQLTDNKYNEVIINDKYEMMVRFKDNLLEQKYLSNGAIDQLYLCLRVAFVKLIFSKEEYITFLDDAFVQYDDIRRNRAILFLINTLRGQILIFTCQKNEIEILEKNNIRFTKTIM
ncbi:MAG: AAA family ATPase [Clostridiales bacterium]|nr:AAA family ATPase [Clostridiales bacterium]